MRLVIGLLLALIVPAIASTPAAAEPKLLWETKGLANPESVVRDPLTGALYVSNVNGAVMQKDGNLVVYSPAAGRYTKEAYEVRRKGSWLLKELAAARVSSTSSIAPAPSVGG